MIDLSNAIALWFMEVSETSNWLAGVSRTDENGKLLLQWRMRYYEKGSPPDSPDERNWYEGIVTATEDEAIEKLRTVARILTQHAEGQMYELLRGDKSTEQFLNEIETMSWAYVTKTEVTPDI